MLIRKMVRIAPLCAVAAMAFGAATASATTVENAGGALAAGTQITNGASDPSVLNVSSLGTVTCTNTTTNLSVGASGGATVSGTLNSLTFQTCTDTIPLIAISSCHLVSPLPSVVITGSGSTGGTVTLNGTYVRCNVSGGTSGCYYFASTANGTGVNATHSLAYSGVSVTHSVPTGGTGDLGSLCGTTGSFSTTLTSLQAGGSAVNLTG